MNLEVNLFNDYQPAPLGQRVRSVLPSGDGELEVIGNLPFAVELKKYPRDWSGDYSPEDAVQIVVDLKASGLTEEDLIEYPDFFTCLDGVWYCNTFHFECEVIA